MTLNKTIIAFIILLFTSNVMNAQVIEEEIIEEEILEEEILDENISDETVATEETTESTPKKKTLTKEISGNIRGDYRFYPEDALYPGQKPDYFSAVFNPELYLEWANRKQLIQFKGFSRLNQHDNNQTHWDVRELYYQRVFKKWEFSVGAKQIYWGFTESNHLANVINQDDFLEGNDIENKLGQPMVHLSFSQKFGVFDFMVMPYFRALEFPGENGRGRPPFQIGEKTLYESEHEEYNPDLALRWSHNIKSFDLAVSHFYGTSRTPLFRSEFSPSTSSVIITPYHELINQTALEFQLTTGAMLWKLEAIHRFSERKTIKAFTAGGEYTFSNIFKTDVGILVEYTNDDRGDESINGLNDDFFVGMRIGFNDKQSTDFLGGANIDREKGTITFFAEANRRIGDSWKISAKALGFDKVDETDFLYLIRKDGFVEFSLAKYF